jgi:clan AA aspartic protease
MKGQVERLHALIPLPIYLSDETNFQLEFVVDTGFTGAFTLPTEAIRRLGLPYLYSIPADLADDSIVEVPIHEMIVTWGGTKQVVAVLGMGHRPLLGTALLRGHSLQADFIEEGAVSITALESNE